MNALVHSTYFLQGWHLKTNLILEHDITFKLKSYLYEIGFKTSLKNCLKYHSKDLPRKCFKSKIN